MKDRLAELAAVSNHLVFRHHANNATKVTHVQFPSPRRIGHKETRMLLLLLQWTEMASWRAFSEG